MKFDDQTYIRKDIVEGETNWLWTKGEIGAWNGPVNDWQSSHSEKYFKYLKKKDVVITAGANQGLYARLYAKHFHRVYAFEPDPLNFFCLTFNTQSLNVLKFQMALGETSKMVSIQPMSKKNSGEHKIVDTDIGAIPCVPLDSFNFQTVDLIQLDVEGYESNVLTGAEHTISKFKPVIIVENGTHEDIIKIMKKFRYHFADQSVADTIYMPD